MPQRRQKARAFKRCAQRLKAEKSEPTGKGASFVLATSGRTFKVPNSPIYFGDPIGIADVWILTTVPNAQAHVEIQIDGIGKRVC